MNWQGLGSGAEEHRGAEALFAPRVVLGDGYLEIGRDHQFGCSGGGDYHYGYSDPKDRGSQDLEGSK